MKETKTCKVCSIEQSITEFTLVWSKKVQKNYIRNQCKACERKRSREYHQSNKGSIRKRHSAQQILSKYGISPEAYEDILAAQGGGCAICNSKCTSGRKLAVDHDHSCCPGTGQKTCGACVRGLLCIRCNMVLGWFEDSAERFQRAADYIRWHRGVG